MDNFDDFENKSYVKATRVDYKFSDLINFTLHITNIIIQLLFALFVEIFIQIHQVFSPAKPKNISGQLALVTGAFESFIVLHSVLNPSVYLF